MRPWSIRRETSGLLPARAVDRGQLAWGLVLLLVGTSVYLVSRPDEATAIMLANDSIQGLFRAFPDPFGPLAQFAPDYLHPLAFSLMSAALVMGRRAKLVMCLAWFLINLGFELGQASGGTVFDFLPDRLVELQLLQIIQGYFAHGTFDIYDVLAIGLGSTTAACVVLWRERERSLRAMTCDRTG